MRVPPVVVPKGRLINVKRFPPMPGAQVHESSVCSGFELWGLKKGLFQDYENTSLCVRTDLSVHFRVIFVNQPI